MPILEDVTEYIYSVCDNVRVTRGGLHFHSRCPVCGDSEKSRSKKRFHLQFDDEKSVYWQCWNCGESGNFYDLYSRLENTSKKEALRKFEDLNSKSVLRKLGKDSGMKTNLINNDNKYHYQEQENKNFNYILENCLSLDSNPQGYIQSRYYEILKDFIHNRKIDCPIYIAYKGEYKGRIILPIYDHNNNIIFFQGRSTVEGMEPKYINPSVEKENIILNRDRFDKNKYIVITEGIIDANMVGNQGTCMLGKEISDTFLNNTRPYTDKGIIIALDMDEKKKIKDYCRIYKKCYDLLFFIIPEKYKDCKDLNDLVIYNYINRSEVYSFVVKNSYNPIEAQVKLYSVSKKGGV